MKLIVAVIQPDKYQAVKAALDRMELSVLSLTQVNSQPHRTNTYRGAKYLSSSPKLRLEIACDDSIVESVVQQIARDGFTSDAAVSGGDKVFVTQLDAYIAQNEEWTRESAADHLHNPWATEPAYAHRER